MAIYGVQFNGTSSAGTRTDDAVGLVWQRSTNTVAGQDDFASLAPFNVRECVTKYNSSLGKREVLGYKGDTGYSTLRSNTANDIMIEFPLFWYQRPSKWRWRVSDRPEVGFKPSPMHYRNGVLYKYARIAKYCCNSSYISRNSSSPLLSTATNTFRTNFRNKKQYMQDYVTRCSIAILQNIKYANLNVQSVVGIGVTQSSGAVSSGVCDNLLGLDGSPTSVSTSESVLSFGIENLWGNCWENVDGLVRYGGTNGGNIYVTDNIDSITSNPTASTISSWTKAGTRVYTDGNDFNMFSDIVYDSVVDWAMYPTNSVWGGTWQSGRTATSQPINDGSMNNTNASYVYMLAMSGRWDDYNGAGIFTFNVSEDFSGGFYSVGTRSIEFSDPIPQKQLYIKDNNEVYAMMQPQ